MTTRQSFSFCYFMDAAFAFALAGKFHLQGLLSRMSWLDTSSIFVNRDCKGKKSSFNGDESWNSISVNEFAAPAEDCEKTYLLHEPAREITAGQEYQIHATIVSPKQPLSVKLLASLPGGAYKTITMANDRAYSYSCKLESDDLKPGYIKYRIVVEGDEGKRTFPGDVNGSPDDWDFYTKETWSSRVVDKNAPILLFDAELHAEKMIKPTRLVKLRLLPSSKTNGSIVEIDTKNLKNKEHDYSLKYCFKNDIPDTFSICLNEA